MEHKGGRVAVQVIELIIIALLSCVILTTKISNYLGGGENEILDVILNVHKPNIPGLKLWLW